MKEFLLAYWPVWGLLLLFACLALQGCGDSDY